ncbi:hypothetical protein LCGC14_0220280 [marine sediment metagenome]|uniref:Uncharacterized protein n=1 Tax=marine sediment metagenome TaxID=412755 RepID=A0A0F9UUI5_9ZZZZ
MDLLGGDPKLEDAVEKLLAEATRRGDEWRAIAAGIEAQHERERKQLARTHASQLTNRYIEWKKQT